MILMGISFIDRSESSAMKSYHPHLGPSDCLFKNGKLVDRYFFGEVLFMDKAMELSFNGCYFL
ncbi:hypothetical protein STEG23_035459, partial [Scotinomys teguina]